MMPGMRTGLRALLLLIGVLPFAPGAAHGEEARVAKNRPPQISGSSPRNFFQLDPVDVRWGREVRFQVGVLDPDGDVTETRMEPGKDVEGATYDPADRIFRWTPTQAQKGQHEIRFVVSDGTLSETRVARFEVVDNRAPEFRERHQQVSGNSNTQLRIRFAVTDKDGDKLSYHVANLPAGAWMEVDDVVCWTPREGQVGRHIFQVSVSDGQASASHEVEVVIEDEWNTSFLPGLYYSVWRPRARNEIGTFQGVGMELVPYAWIHRNANRGPSHGRITLRADLLDSSRDGVGLALIYSMGLDLSIERNPYRRWLIPFFGVDFGGISQSKVGHLFQSSPHLGLYLWTTRNVFVTVSGAYQLVPSHLDTLGGWRASAGLNLTLW
jgi:hypothetical protein